MARGLVVTPLFPVFMVDPTDPAWTVYVLESREAAEEGVIEPFDVEDQNFVIWDTRGVRLRAQYAPGDAQRLELISIGIEDMEGLLAAIARYGQALGLPREDVIHRAPLEAVRRIEEAEQRRQRKRSWYEFWRRR